MRTDKTMLMVALVTILICSLGSTLASAQVSQNAPAAEEDVYVAPPHYPAGPFAKGSKRLNIVGGAGSTLGQTYLILGVGFSYFIADGLSLGFSGEGWVLQDPTIWKISPDIRYTFWKMNKFKPYVGAFYRRTYMGGDFSDYNSWGGRAGVAYRQGGSYVSLGVVYEEFIDVDSHFGDSNNIYPELSFWFSF